LTWKDCLMNICEIFERFAKAYAEIILYKRAVKTTAKNEFNELMKNEPLFNTLGFQGIPVSASNVHFKEARTGDLKLITQQRHSIEDKKKSVFLHKNRQYRWILAEAYEIFEDFLEEAYVFAGLTDETLWHEKDLNALSQTSVEQTRTEMLVGVVKNKRDKPSSILNQFRNCFEELGTVELEKGNELQLNMKFTLILIEHLRHIIVHKKGNVSNFQMFCENVIKKSGVYNNGNYPKEYLDFIKLYFGANELENTITLLEYEITEGGITFTDDRFENTLLNCLIAYAQLISVCLDEHYKRINPVTP